MAEEIRSVDLSALDEVLDTYAGVKGSTITILQKTQDLYGYIPEEAMYRISERTGESPAQIKGVATFYSQFRFQPVGKYLIKPVAASAIMGVFSIAAFRAVHALLHSMRNHGETPAEFYHTKLLLSSESGFDIIIRKMVQF